MTFFVLADYSIDFWDNGRQKQNRAKKYPSPKIDTHSKLRVIEKTFWILHFSPP